MPLRVLTGFRSCLAILLFASAVCGVRASDFVLSSGSSRLTFNTNGVLVGWTGQFNSVTNSPRAFAGKVRCNDISLPLESPQISNAAGQLSFTYRWPGVPELTVTIHHSFAKNHGTLVWLRNVEIHGNAKLASDLTVSLQSCPGPLPANMWLPLVNGTGAELGTNEAAIYRLAGKLPGDGVALAIPMISMPADKNNRLLIATDPYFSTRFRSGAIEWTYPAKGGLENGCEKRTIAVAVHKGSADDSLAAFFRILLSDVEPGPAWLHDIALVDFDYLSDGGQGWFNDIDALSSAFSREDRRQAFLCLHGCYDFLGRYCFDSKTGKFDKEWTSFSNYDNVSKQRTTMIGGTKVQSGFGNSKPRKMSLAEEHQRLRYARSRGFRVGIYFADGLNAGDGLPDFSPDRVLRYGGWQGPDSKGKSYFQNPLNPNVRAFYMNYAKAMLEEFGPDVDAMVWDETFHMHCGQLGTDAWPGYADREMMRFVRDITALFNEYNRRHHTRIAMLSSDDLGSFGDVPCALVSHGTYQDSWCRPLNWSYGIFPNYRNVLWSVCWWPLSKWPWIDFGVRNYQAAVSLTNGWGDDKGFSEFTPEQQARAIVLFNWRKMHATRLKWFQQLPQGNL